MKTSRIASLTSVIAAASVIGLATAGPASAATSMSATVYGATVRGKIYTGYAYGNKAVTYSAVLNDTRRSNGYRAELQVRGYVKHAGTSKIELVPFGGPATHSTTSSVRIRSGIYPTGSATKARLKYRVCSRTCSTWQTSPWYSV
ncbi:hypothetical protein AB4028_02260 [Janibacter sp. RAF20_2_2]|uniref:hypothetical protein n=1 Tax=unclassified Janibacter TaxID=2649294 RepID=UPI003F8FB2F2